MLNAAMIIAYVILIPVQESSIPNWGGSPWDARTYIQLDCTVPNTNPPTHGYDAQGAKIRMDSGMWIFNAGTTDADTMVMAMVPDLPRTYTAIVCLDVVDVGAYLQNNKVPSDTWVLDVKTGKLLVPVQKPVMKKREIEEFSHYDWSVREFEGKD